MTNIGATRLLDIISAAPLFHGLPNEQLRDIARIAVEKDFRKGEAIFMEGDKADGFYVVAEGQVKVYKLSFDGKEQILHIFGPGEPFGEVPMFAGGAFPANAEALSGSRLIFFSRTDFACLLEESPGLAMGMLGVLSMRLRQFTVQVEQLSLREVPGRLAHYLLYLSDEGDAADSVDLSISKGQLASLLGTIPETLSRILAKMSKAGLIQVDGRSIRILDRLGLEDLASAGKGLP